eukprot:gnl/TRDRNA2_/TRDRNA2_144413_c0_seq1.p1 gnl/TRDRNA2_/TRDRNA2_144413_c0~~gnl/TRDRNA2_/TRDRNA2_144413_c0_seq1.p1  ORF type:complete len:548 (-),score=87.22 gnl/TRDRNA2_/TRDRNA2_144413_c0_seq1:39-1655(-)
MAIDVVFFLDMAASFRTGFFDADGFLNTVSSEIRSRYLRTWFLIDFFATVPIDRICELVVRLSGGEVGSEVGAVRMVKVLRLVRLLKLARLFKMGRVMAAVEEVTEYSPIAMKCIQLTIRLIVIAHFTGCFWYWISVQSMSDKDSCTAGEFGCSRDVPSQTWWQSLGLEEHQKWDLYIAALYWSSYTMTTVGYGEVNPKNDYERIYAIFVIMVGATIFGYIVGSIAALASQERGIEALTKKRCSMIKDFCEEQNMNLKNEEIMRFHFKFFYESRSPYNEAELLHECPANLRKKLLLHIHRDAIANIGFFAGASRAGLPDGSLPDWFVSFVLQLLEPQVGMAGEDILVVDLALSAPYAWHIDEVFFVTEGECEAYINTSARRSSASGIAAAENQSALHSEYSFDLSGPPPSLLSKISSSMTGRPLISPTGSSTRKPKVSMIFTPGSMFGLEHMVESRHRYNVRCRESGHCLLFVLKQLVVLEATVAMPEMRQTIRHALSSAFAAQTLERVPIQVAETRRSARRASQAAAEEALTASANS